MDEQENKKKRRDRLQGIRDAMNQSMGIELGKLPPQAIDLEEAVLGAFMLDESSLYHGLSILKKEAFYKEANGLIFQAILDLRAKKDPVDIRTVTHQLRAAASLELVGGPLCVSKLTSSILGTANTDTYCRIIMEKFFKREIIRVGNEMVREGYDEETDAFDLQAESVKKVINIVDIKNQALTTAQIADKFYGNLVDRSNDETGTKGRVPSSIQSLRMAMGGYYDTEFIVIAARPGVGKSALLLNEMLYAAQLGIPVAIFSLEMSRDELVARLVAQILKDDKLDAGMLAKGKVTEKHLLEKIEQALASIRTLPLHIWCEGTLTIEQAATHAQRLVEMNGVRMIGFDYIQLMKTTQKTIVREQEVAIVSRGLKKTAMDLKIPIIGLSQIGRESEKRTNKRPILSDLRESGSIEQDANTVIFIHIEEAVELIIAKQRNGGPQTVECKLYPQFTLFTDEELDNPNLPFDDDKPF